MFSTMGFQLKARKFSRPLKLKQKSHVPVVVVDEVTEARRVNNGEVQPNPIFLDI